MVLLQEMAIIKEDGDGWVNFSTDIQIRATGIPKAAAVLHNHKTTDNSSGASPMFISSSHVPQVLLFISCWTQVLQNLL